MQSCESNGIYVRYVFIQIDIEVVWSTIQIKNALLEKPPKYDKIIFRILCVYEY
jgi:hypothetical protein